MFLRPEAPVIDRTLWLMHNQCLAFHKTRFLFISCPYLESCVCLGAEFALRYVTVEVM